MLDEALDKLNDDFEDARSPEGIETLVSKTGINNNKIYKWFLNKKFYLWNKKSQ